jgi:hypothetical protein
VAFGTVKFYKSHKGWGAISSPALPPGLDAFIPFGNIVRQSGYRAPTTSACDFPTFMSTLDLLTSAVSDVLTGCASRGVSPSCPQPTGLNRSPACLVRPNGSILGVPSHDRRTLLVASLPVKTVEPQLLS